MNKEEVEKRTEVYEYLGSQDRHIIRLFRWIKILEHFADEIRESEIDRELEDEIKNVVSKLTYEVGVRITMIFPVQNSL